MISTISRDLQTLKEEVIEVNDKILKICETNEKVKKLYKGCQIYISPLYQNTNILFLGINPGGGYYKKTGKIQQKFEPLEKNDTGYGLWKAIEKCFAKMGEKQLLDDMVKSNHYFFCTNREADLYKMLELFPHELKNEIKEKSKKWVKTIISEISPKIIICGGKSSMGKIQELYPGYEIMQQTEYTKAIKINGTYVIGFNRLFSRILKKKEFMEYFQKYFSRTILDKNRTA